jgi:para-aminobenzoate synthetase component 1
MLNWIRKFNIFCFLDSNDYPSEDSSFEWIAGIGASDLISVSDEDVFSRVEAFHNFHPGWLFGHFNYPSLRKDFIGFPQAFFFVPDIIIRSVGNKIEILSDTHSAGHIHNEILAQSSTIKPTQQSSINIQHSVSKEKYVQIVQQLQKHILRGDCYEMNYCIDFFSHNAVTDPYFLFSSLSELSPNPFSAFYRLEDKYCICASPERFLKKSGSVIFSQPIKGTAKRNLENIQADDQLKNNLLQSEKERSENVMIVDLVRNDLSRVCKPGSVYVDELFGIYSFPQVHQMISTVKGTIIDNTHWTKIIESCYPMGSMTGAPKIKVMELIEKYEEQPRGLFSGTIGYVSPDGNFDFNVVIRSLFYNSTNQRLSFKAGSGITFNSIPAFEYDECLAKASALMNILNNH